MDEPRSHYQLSFTSRQALLLFVGLLAALGVAYTLGVLTGLAGRKGEAPASETASAAIAPTPEPTAAPAGAPTPAGELELPKPVRGISQKAGATSSSAAGHSPGSVTRMAEPPGGPAAAPAATPAPDLQLFEDEGVAASSPQARSATASARHPAPASPPAPASASMSASVFWVQAISASSPKEAEARRQRLTAHGFPSAVVPGESPAGARVYRVRVGPYKTREEADHAAAKLKSREKLQPWVVPPGK